MAAASQGQGVDDRPRPDRLARPTEDLVTRLLGRPRLDRTDLTGRLGPRLDGWLPLDDTSVSREEQREKFRGETRQEGYQSDLAARRQEVVDERPCAPEASVFFTRLAETIESLGATPVFVTQPSLNLQEDLVKAWRDGLVDCSRPSTAGTASTCPRAAR
jgi:hypothetical protein